MDRKTHHPRPGIFRRIRNLLRETHRQFAAAYHVLANPALTRTSPLLPPPIPAPLAVPPLATWALDAKAMRDLELRAPMASDVAAVLDADEVLMGSDAHLRRYVS